jgi:peptidoglycan/LPS O-acetylase OafA/YrhL
MPRRELSRSGQSCAEADASSKARAAAHAGVAIQGDRIPPLDGVRGLAILMVMLTHYDAFLDRRSFPQHILLSVFDYGWAGVDLFFVLSGFLITGILLRSREASNYFRVFYARRILRIFPLYYFSLLVLFGLLLPAFHSQGQILPTFPEKLRYLLYIQNWFIAVQWSGQYWSLAVEEQFYLVWPLIVYLFGRKRTLQIAIGASLFSLVLRFVLFGAGVNPILILTNVFTRLDSLMIGAACACLAQEGGFVDWFRRASSWHGSRPWSFYLLCD